MTAFVIIFEGPFFYQSSTRIFEPFWDSIYRFFSDRFFFEIPEILSTSGWLYIYIYIYIRIYYIILHFLYYRQRVTSVKQMRAKTYHYGALKEG